MTPETQQPSQEARDLAAKQRLISLSEGAAADAIYGKEWCFDPAVEMRRDLRTVMADFASFERTLSAQPIGGEVERLRSVARQAWDNMDMLLLYATSYPDDSHVTAARRFMRELAADIGIDRTPRAEGAFRPLDHLQCLPPYPSKALAQPQASEKKTMCLVLTDKEQAALEDLMAKQDLSREAVMRQALRQYQLSVERIRSGETVTWSGDAQRVREFAGLAAQPQAKGGGEERVLMLDIRGLSIEQVANINAHYRGITSDRPTYPFPESGRGWVCFHCGERFTTPGGARMHFGSTPDTVPTCLAQPPSPAATVAETVTVPGEGVEGLLAHHEKRADDAEAEADRLRAFLSAGSLQMLESEQAWKRRALVAEAALSAQPQRDAGEGTGIAAIAAERRRQVEQEGWTPEHDDQHGDGSLAAAGAAYAFNAATAERYFAADPLGFWPWDKLWWKPRTQREDLIRAGALIAAEIDRLDRAALATPKQRPQGGVES